MNSYNKGQPKDAPQKIKRSKNLVLLILEEIILPLSLLALGVSQGDLDMGGSTVFPRLLLDLRVPIRSRSRSPLIPKFMSKKGPIDYNAQEERGGGGGFSLRAL